VRFLLKARKTDLQPEQRARERLASLPRLVPPVPSGTPAAPTISLDAATVRQWLWGEGFVTPGARDHVLELAEPLRLAPGMTVLDATAGLGGTLRLLAETFGVDVDGLERDVELARIAQAAPRARVRLTDPESFDLAPLRYDAILARQASYAVRGKERYFRVLMQGLKPKGALMLEEFMLDRAGDAAALARWAPDPPPELWTLERYGDCLRNLGFELRIVGDITPDYRALVLAGWTGLMAAPELRRLPRGAFPPIIDEAERAMRMVHALDGGALKVMLIHATARRGG
jgi:SAM-dependent methyltransferase